MISYSARVSAGEIGEDELDDAELPERAVSAGEPLRLVVPGEPGAAATPVPAPPADPEELLAWAEAHGVAERLDDAFVDGTGGRYPTYGTYWPGRPGERITYRRVLVDTTSGERQRWGYYGLVDDARQMLRRMATATAHRWRERAWMEANGRDPDAPPLVAFLELLRKERTALQSERLGSGRLPGTFFPVGVVVRSAPTPALRYGERALNVSDHDPARVTTLVTLALLAWNEAPPRWSLAREYERKESLDVPVDLRLSAVEAMIDFVRDPRRAAELDELSELLLMPAWRFALGDLDRRLARLTTPSTAGPPSGPAAAAGPDSRMAFRVRCDAGGRWDIEPLLQKRQKRGTFSKGQRMEWYRAIERPELTESDRRVFRAHDDPFVRSSEWGRTLAQTFGVLTALIDHPAVVLDGPKGERRPDIRKGRLRLRFGTGREGSLTPQLELLGHLLGPSEVAAAATDGRHVILLREVERQPPQILLARISPEAASVVGALALAPGSFPSEAHDALATRLEGLQEAMDIEFPSQWTRTIAPADGRPLVRLELLGSGAIHVKMAVRPVKLGPVFAPGDGPTLVLEGQGRERHGARRDLAAERQAALATAERLELSSATETEAWAWRVTEGDPALHVVAALRDLGDAVVVEWADDARLVSLGRVGRGDLRLQVADKRDWFGVEGGAKVGDDAGGSGNDATVTLAQLFAAIRDGHRYVKVGGRGFVRIEDSLRAALARAEGAVFEHRGALQISAVGSDALMGLVEHQAQLEATASFRALRERMKESEAAEPRLAPAMAATLRPYQHAGVRWLCRLAHWGAGAVLADEMGLGKTVQTLAALSHRSSLGPALVVAPTSVVPNWLAETARFAPELTLCDLRGPAARAALASGTRTPAAGELWVTSYAIATLEAETLARHRFATLIVDEAQAVKNATTDRARALRDLDADWRLALTGTPIENRLSELWSILRVTSPGLLGSWEQFRARYAVPIEKFGDDGRRQALAALLRPFVLRRTKNEVARDLPDRTEVVRSVRLSPEERALYEELRRATLEDLERAKKDPDRDASGMRFVLLASLTRLRQLCCHPRLVYPDSVAGSSKTAYLLELLGELREGGHKVLVFSQFRSLLELLAPRLVQQGHRVLVLDGTTPADVRERRIAAFQAGQADVFLISLKAGGFGLNLTAADTVIHMDPWWNPAVEDQATARAHRIGQAKPVTAIRLVARDTVEEAVLELHAAKRTLAASVLEGSEVAAGLDDQQLAALIASGLDHAP